MRISRLVFGAFLAFGLSAGATPLALSGPTVPIPAGTYNWYESEDQTTLVGYQIVECSGTIHGPYPGPGRMFAEITPYEEYIPQAC